MRTLTLAAAWDVLHAVPDPEIPVISVTDLGIVRGMHEAGGVWHVQVTPTYSGCPATEVIADSIRSALLAAGAQAVAVEHVLQPAWSSDWMSEAGKDKLKKYGIAPPACTAHASGTQGTNPLQAPSNRAAAQPLQFFPSFQRAAPQTGIQCPRCGSDHTERLSAFGSTPCKSLHRCRSCAEPFDYFKPI